MFNIDVIELFPLLEHVDEGIDHFRKIMRRDGGCHADRDTRRAVDQKVRQRRRQNARLCERIVEIGGEVNGVLIEIEENIERGGGQARFGITHRSRRVAIHGTEVALSIHEQGAHGKILRHACHGFIDRRVAVRVIFTEHFTHDTGGFFVGRVGADAHVVHRIQDAALHRFESIARIGQGARHDHRHGVIEIRLLHFIINIYFPN